MKNIRKPFISKCFNYTETDTQKVKRLKPGFLIFTFLCEELKPCIFRLFCSISFALSACPLSGMIGVANLTLVKQILLLYCISCEVSYYLQLLGKHIYHTCVGFTKFHRKWMIWLFYASEPSATHTQNFL